MSNKKLQTLNKVHVVEELNDKELQIRISKLRRALNRNTGKIFTNYTTSKELIENSKYNFNEFPEGYVHPFELEEGEIVSNIACINYVVEGEVKAYIYLFEIKQDDLV